MNPNVQAEAKALGQTVLVLQGGGALGAYQVGVYEALAESGIDVEVGLRPTKNSRFGSAVGVSPDAISAFRS